MRWRAAAVIGGGVLGGLVSQVAPVGCGCGEPCPQVAVPCDATHGNDDCCDGQICCSDDPAAREGALPAYAGKGIAGAEPLFSGVNNERSRSGMCVRTEDIPAGVGLLEPNVESCPIPCNPTWTKEEIEAVCGRNLSCCQLTELEEADCVLDEELGCYRPARGEDILELGDPWDEHAHATHQDPGLRQCADLAAGGGQAALEDCYRQLSVADQRGYCLFLATGAGEACAEDQPDHVSACDRVNVGAGLVHCVE